MEKLRIHDIKIDSYTILYFCDTMTIKKVDNLSANVYHLIANNVNRNDIEQQYFVSHELYTNIYNDILEEYKSYQSIQTCDIDNDYFSTLILNVSNDCNMCCEYCFANHGVYNSQRGLMPKKIAISTIDLYYKKYSYIREIKFFGGEPMMNISVIQAVCAHIYKKFKNNEIKGIPRFKIITNGTILNNVIIDIINEYSIDVIFSIDGPPCIHDKIRKFKNNAPSHETILKNLYILKESTNNKQPCSIEVTYTNEHINLGFSIKDITKYFYEKIGIPEGQVNVSFVELPLTHPLALPHYSVYWIQFAEDVINAQKNGNKFYGDLKLMGMIFKLKNKKPHSTELCPAASSWSAVSASGDVYPCLMFMDNKNFKMGNVQNDIFQSNIYKSIKSQFTDYHPKMNENCKYCFANQVCNQCAGINHFMTGKISQHYPEHCLSIKNTLEILIRGIADGII